MLILPPGQQLIVASHKPVNHDIGGELSFDRVASCLGHFPGLFRIAKELQNSFRRGLRVFTVHQVSTAALFDCLRVATDARGNAGEATRHSLDKGVRESFTARRKKEDVAHLQKGEDILGFSEKSDILSKPQFRNARLEFPKVFRIGIASDHQEGDAREFSNDLGGGFYQDVNSLNGTDVTHGNNYRRGGVHTESATQALISVPA